MVPIPNIDRDDLAAYRCQQASGSELNDKVYLIRSMSTTDYAPQYNRYPQPFHIYLKKPERRRPRDCWSVYCDDVQLFDTVNDALGHGAAVLGDERFDVVPVIDRDLPTYWAARAINHRNRVIGTEIVGEQ